MCLTTSRFKKKTGLGTFVETKYYICISVWNVNEQTRDERHCHLLFWVRRKRNLKKSLSNL